VKKEMEGPFEVGVEAVISVPYRHNRVEIVNYLIERKTRWCCGNINIDEKMICSCIGDVLEAVSSDSLNAHMMPMWPLHPSDLFVPLADSGLHFHSSVCHILSQTRP